MVASINCSNAHIFAPGSLSGKMSQLWCRLHFAFLFCESVSKWRADQGWDMVILSQMHSMPANQETDQKLSETDTARLPGISDCTDQSANHSQLLPLHHKCTERVVRVLKCNEQVVRVLISARTTRSVHLWCSAKSCILHIPDHSGLVSLRKSVSFCVITQIDLITISVFDSRVRFSRVRSCLSAQQCRALIMIKHAPN